VASLVSLVFSDSGFSDSFHTHIHTYTHTHIETPDRLWDFLAIIFSKAFFIFLQKRLIGFGIFLACGIFFTALSTLLLPMIVIKPHKFAVAYSLGNHILKSFFFLYFYFIFEPDYGL